MTKIDAARFLSDLEVLPEHQLSGPELVRAYWRARAAREELERKERYWTSVCDALSTAYGALERELAGAQSDHVARLNRQVQVQVQERARELLSVMRDMQRHVPYLEPGRMLGERTRIGEALGEGGAGVVYAAWDSLHGDVAVKVLRRIERPEHSMRLLRESLASSQVEHATVVRPLHVDLAPEGFVYLIMERVAGITLRAHLQTHGAMPLPAALRLVGELAAGLAAAHARGVAHRDVKSANVMLTRRTPGLRILDFGLARLADDPAEHSQAGTPAYMAPEPVRGPAADVYSTAITFCELVHGELPSSVSAMPALANWPDAVARIIQRALATQPEQRPSSAELAAVLTGAADACGARAAEIEAAALMTPIGDATVEA